MSESVFEIKNNDCRDMTLEIEPDLVIASGGDREYLSVERLGEYLFKVSFDYIPDYVENNDLALGSCTSFIRDGKLYRNYDWNYDNTAGFLVMTKEFTGMGAILGLYDGELDRDKIEQLPYHLVDGVNKYGIKVAAHILYNDFEYAGSGEKNKSLAQIPYYVLSNLHDISDIETVMEDYLANLKIPQQLIDMEYLMQFVVTDGTTSYVITPKTDGSGYEIVNITTVPKLTNFKWVNSATVNRTDSNIQERPTGIERWNQIGSSTKLLDLRFTKCYESPTRLSEFIGIDDTTKESTDAELLVIYNKAKAEYESRKRDAKTWQTVHSVVYNGNTIENLCVQEEFNKNYITDLSSLEEYVQRASQYSQQAGQYATQAGNSAVQAMQAADIVQNKFWYGDMEKYKEDAKSGIIKNDTVAFILNERVVV